MITIGDTVTKLMQASQFSSGAAYAATGTPVGVIYKNGVADALTVTATIVNGAGEVGLWKFVFTPTVAAGFAAADFIELRVTATVDGVAAAATVWADRIEAVDMNTLNEQLANITLTGAALNDPADSDTLTTGTETSGTYASTRARDGVYHQITDAGGEIDIYYEFNIGGDGVPVSFFLYGHLTGNNDDLAVQAYRWGVGWEYIGTLAGKTTSVDEAFTYGLYTSHVGTGADLGKVRIRFYDAGLTTANLYLDQIYCSYAVVHRTVGYADGAIWVDTNASNTNTESFVDGTADNPVSTWAAALTLSTNLNIDRFRIINGSTIQLSGAATNYTLLGDNWTLDLNGQAAAGAFFAGARVSGVVTGAYPHFDNCMFAAATIPPCHMMGCGFSDTITAGSAGSFSFEDCHSMVAGVATPVFDFGAGLNASAVNFRHYSGGIEIENIGAGTGAYTMSLEGHGQLIINANCSATATIAIRGHFTVTDNAGGAVTLSDDARFTLTDVQAAALAAITAFGGATEGNVTAVLNAVAALNNLSSADTQAAAAAALAAFGTATEANVTAVGLAVSNLQDLSAADAEAACVAALTAFGAATEANVTAVGLAVATLHDLSLADAQAACAAALTAYTAATAAQVAAVGVAVAAVPTAVQIATAVFAHTAGLTATGTIPYSTIVKALLAIMTGRWKEVGTNIYEIYDNNETTLILTLTKISATEYKTTWA